jgi:hypothetical protein
MKQLQGDVGLDRIRNEMIRKMTDMEKDIKDEVQKRQLIRSGH